MSTFVIVSSTALFLVVLLAFHPPAAAESPAVKLDTVCDAADVQFTCYQASLTARTEAECPAPCHWTSFSNNWAYCNMGPCEDYRQYPNSNELATKLADLQFGGWDGWALSLFACPRLRYDSEDDCCFEDQAAIELRETGAYPPWKEDGWVPFNCPNDWCMVSTDGKKCVVNPAPSASALGTPAPTASTIAAVAALSISCEEVHNDEGTNQDGCKAVPGCEIIYHDPNDDESGLCVFTRGAYLDIFGTCDSSEPSPGSQAASPPSGQSPPIMKVTDLKDNAEVWPQE